ncbi:MAG: class I SAM-dependent methyltransferase, partial [Chitinophagales bacterium]
MRYNRNFYSDRELGSSNSAIEILQELQKHYKFQSFLDVGCGNGAWSKAYSELCNDNYIGIDGSYVLETNKLLIPVEKFIAKDLKKGFDLNSKFHLVISMEVAEHLPESSADIFIESLVNHGDVVLFSAAIPNQQGTDHVNEQWQSYWIKLFDKNNYRAIDILRDSIWDNSKIDAWYRQNTILFIRKDSNDLQRLFANYVPKYNPDRIHPDM